MKKTFKILGVLMMIVLFSMSFTSCSKDEKGGDSNHDKRLIGSWTEREDWEDDGYADITWTFKSDGNFEQKAIVREYGETEIYKTQGKWETEDDEYLYLEFRVDGERNTDIFEYEVEGKRLYIYFDGDYIELKKK